MLNRRVAYFKSFSGLKPKRLSHHTIPILEEYEYDPAILAILHVGIKDLLRFDKNSTIHVSICDDIIIAGLRIEILILKKYFFQAWHSVQKLLQI